MHVLLIRLLASLALALPGCVFGQTNAGFWYVTNAGAITITGPKGYLWSAVIPESIAGLPVTRIAASAFESYGMLTNAVIPRTVTNIGEYAFFHCGSLKAITVHEQNPAYSSVEGVLHNRDQTTVIQFPCGRVGSFAIPGTVTNFADGAFAFCTGLTNVTMPNSLLSIGGHAFHDCYSLLKVELGGNVRRIESFSFYFCTNLSSVTIPASVEMIEDWVFYGCAGLRRLQFEGNAPLLGEQAFNSLLISYYLPGMVGWGATYGGRPTAPWLPQVQTSGAITVAGANCFGLAVHWASGQVVLVEASAALGSAPWIPVATNTLSSASWYLSDPSWTNHYARFYRVRSL